MARRKNKRRRIIMSKDNKPKYQLKSYEEFVQEKLKHDQQNHEEAESIPTEQNSAEIDLNALEDTEFKRILDECPIEEIKKPTRRNKRSNEIVSAALKRRLEKMSSEDVEHLKDQLEKLDHLEKLEKASRSTFKSNGDSVEFPSSLTAGLSLDAPTHEHEVMQNPAADAGSGLIVGRRIKTKKVREVHPTNPFTNSPFENAVHQPRKRATSASGVGYRGDYSYEPSAKYLDPSPYTEEMKAIFGENSEGEILTPLEAGEATISADCEMFDAVRENLKIYRIQERTIVYAVVVDKSGETNQSSAIRCYGGVAFGGYARDTNRDAYLVNCVEYISVGTVPFALQVSMVKIGDWKVKIPIPEKVLEKAFTPQQRKLMQMYREKYPAEKYDVHYLQMLGAN